MAQFVQSGNTSITGQINVASGLPTPTAAQTPVQASVNNQNNGATVYTVTSGKTFYCTGAHISSISTNVTCILSVAGTQKLYTVALTGIRCEQVFSGGVLFTATSGQTITISGAGATSNCCDIWGWEE